VATETLNVRVTSTGTDQLARGFGRVEQSIRRTGSASTRASQQMARGFSAAKTAIAGYLGVAALARGGKAILAFDDALSRLQVDANLSNKEALKLRDSVLALSGALGIPKEQLSGSLQVFQDFGGYLGFGRDIMRDLAKFSKATGTSMDDAATIAATLHGNLKMNKEEVLDTLPAMKRMADAGQISMKMMAGVMPSLLGAGATMGFKGQRGVEQMGTALQVVGAAGKGPQESATSAIALLRELKQKAKEFEKQGIKVLDKDGTMRDVTDVMREIAQKSGGLLTKGPGALFGADAAMAAGAFFGNIDAKTGQWTQGSTAERVMAASKEGKAADIDVWLKKTLGGIGSESEKIKQALAKLDAAFQTYGQKVLVWAAQNPYGAAGAALGGLVALKGGGGLLKWLLSRGKGGGGGIAGATGVQPVFVVNMPGAHFGQAAAYGLGPGGAGGPASAAGKAGRLAGLAGKLGGAAGVLGAAGAGYALGSWIDQKTGASRHLADALVGATAGRAARRRTAAHGKAVGISTVGDQASALVRLAQSGVGSFESAPGHRQALTGESAAAFLRESAQKQGVSQEALAPILRAMLEELKRAPVQLKTGGIDGVRVEAGRGR
jgi:TP901 family phage tail tape measure protein